MDLIYQAKQMWGILSHPEYADANDGFDSLMTQNALSYLAQEKPASKKPITIETSGVWKLENVTNDETGSIAWKSQSAEPR